MLPTLRSFYRVLLPVLLLGGASLSGQWLPVVEVEVNLPDGTPYEGPLDPLFVDQAGMIWFSRYNKGIGRYDGEKMTIYGEENGLDLNVLNIVQDRAGYLWVSGSGRGTATTTLARSNVPFIDGEEPPTVYFSDSLPGFPLLDKRINELLSDADGNIWAHGMGTLVHYQYNDAGQLLADTILTATEEFPVSSFGLGNNRELYVVKVDSVLLRSTIDHREGDDFEAIPLTPKAKNINHIIVDDHGDIWLKASTRLYHFEEPDSSGANQKLNGREVPTRITGNSSMAFSDEETVLLAVPDQVIEIDRTTSDTRRIYNHSTDLNVPAFQSILHDGVGNIWMGTITGLARMPADYRAYASPNNRTMGPAAEIPDNTIVQTVRMGGPDNKWLLVGTTTGLYIRNEENSWLAINKDSGLLLPNILGIDSDDNGRIWATSTTSAINLLSPPDFVHSTSVRPTPLSIFGNDYVVSAIRSSYMYSPFVLPLDREGDEPAVSSLWGGSRQYGQSLTDEFPWLWFYESSGYKSGVTSYFAQDKQGRIIAGSGSATLLRTKRPVTYEYYKELYENSETKLEGVFYKSQDSTVFESITLRWDTTTFPVIEGMAAIGDELWLGVETGALILDLQTLEAKSFIPVSCDGCVPIDFAYDPDRNRIWAASSSGILEIDAEGHHLLGIVDVEGGLRGNDGYSPQCITIDQSGIVYYATSGGLAAYNPDLARPEADSFPVYVRKWTFVEDKWGKNEATLSYSVLDFRNKEKTYQTKLEGYDDDWSEATKNANLRYTNLPAYLFSKTYIFRVRAQDDGGKWIEAQNPASIKVSPPWYLSWWAALVALVALALAIRQFLRLKLRRQAEALALQEAEVIKEQRDEIKLKNDQNELLLKEIHHRVKNNLEVVSSLLELQSAGLADSDARDAMQAGQSRVQSMGLLHQKLYQGDNLAAIEMEDYFNNLAASLLETYGAEERIRIDVNMLPLNIDVDTAVPLGLIVNELLTNTIKYAFGSAAEGEAAGAVEVGLSKEGNSYLLRVKDNGSGKDFDAPATGSGFGTRLVDLLSRQLGGTLSEVNDGGLRTELRFNERPS